MAPKSSTQKPGKPYKEFPLFAHPNGQWAKKIIGKPWYFGKWENPEDALQKYLDEVDDIQAGRDPRRQGVVLVSDDTTVAEMLNLFLSAQDGRRAAAEISDRHFSDYPRSSKTVVDLFGPSVRVTALRATDFAAFRKSFPETRGPTKVGTEIQRIRTGFAGPQKRKLSRQSQTSGQTSKSQRRPWSGEQSRIDRHGM